MFSPNFADEPQNRDYSKVIRLSGGEAHYQFDIVYINGEPYIVIDPIENKAVPLSEYYQRPTGPS
ncbi:MAG: hypothetical protein MJ137_08430 [Clostridia bacterium]|nr:hypothetical protein [Clostridia bacterium]